MNKLLTTILASSVLMMGAMTVAHADEMKVKKSPQKKQHHAAKHQRQHAHNVTTASAHHGQYAAVDASQQASVTGKKNPKEALSTDGSENPSKTQTDAQ